jgi:hypothetical protein
LRDSTDIWRIRRFVCHLCLLWLKSAEQYTQILHINIEDVLITHQIVAAGQLLDIDVLDHLVIGQGRYTSMREKGLGFSR